MVLDLLSRKKVRDPKEEIVLMELLTVMKSLFLLLLRFLHHSMIRLFKCLICQEGKLWFVFVG